MRVTVLDTETKKESFIELPNLQNSFDYLSDKLEFQKKDLYNSFPEGINPAAFVGGMPTASGGEILMANDGRTFSRNVYIRLDKPHDHANTPHVNIDIMDVDEFTGRKSYHPLGELHIIPFLGKRKTIIITLSEGDKTVSQSITIFPGEDSELIRKQQEFVYKLKEKTLTKEDEDELKKLIEKQTAGASNCKEKVV